MNFIRRFINQNRRGIIMAIAVIAFIFIVIPTLNEIAKQREENERKIANETKVELTEDEKNLPTESLLGISSVSVQKTKQNVKLIEEFVEKCNNKDITGAYNMLTNECKEALFQNEEDFKIGYYNLVFSEKRIIDMKQFLSKNNRYTYEVKFYENILSKGKSTGADFYQDYITIDENSSTRKNKFKKFYL